MNMRLCDRGGEEKKTSDLHFKFFPMLILITMWKLLQKKLKISIYTKAASK